MKPEDQILLNGTVLRLVDPVLPLTRVVDKIV